MNSKRAAKKHVSSPRGFTFTISIVILAITLIAMALFSQEWRKSQSVSFTELMPTETARLEERVSSDMGAILGADAHVSKTSTEVAVEISTKMPFKKEGMPLAEMGEYAASLPSTLRNTGSEAILSANSINGSTAAVMKVSDTGQLLYSNDGFNVLAIYFHPKGWQPKKISASIVCGKDASSFGSFVVDGGSGADGGLEYELRYTDSLRSYSAKSAPPANSNAQLWITYPDKTQLVFRTQFSNALEQNYTSITYSKSPSGELIVPFDSNASGGYARDYSSNRRMLALGSGVYSPTWEPSCRNGGCYLFSGSQYITGPALQLTETPLYFAPSAERVANGGFENFTGTPNDNITDSWQGWGIQNDNPTLMLFLATNDSPVGYAVRVESKSSSGGDGAMGSDYIYQAVNNIQENTAYALTFITKGTGGRYEIYDATAGKYLQASGGWGAEYSFATGAPDVYMLVKKEFSLPLNSTSLQLRLLPSTDIGNVYYDEVSLTQSSGLNGGFEHYYKDNGWAPGDGR